MPLFAIYMAFSIASLLVAFNADGGAAELL